MNYISALFVGSVVRKETFETAWTSIVQSLVGRWGRGKIKGIGEEEYTYVMQKDICSFTMSPIARGNVTLKLPFITANETILFILSDGNLTAKAILKHKDSIDLNLIGNSIILTATFEGIQK
jgi:hypothetical protein